MKVQVLLVLFMVVASIQSISVAADRKRRGVHKISKKSKKENKQGNDVTIEKFRMNIKSENKPKINEKHDPKAKFQLNVSSANKANNIEDQLQVELNKRFQKIKSSIQRQKIKTLLEQLEFSQKQIDANMKVKAALAEAQLKLAVKNNKLEQKIQRLQKIKNKRDRKRRLSKKNRKE